MGKGPVFKSVQPVLIGLVLFFICAVANAAGDVVISVVGPDNMPLRGVIVHLYPQFKDVEPAPASAVESILQKNKRYEPYVSVVQKGSVVGFSNVDDITHHIYSVTGPSKFSYTLKAGENSSTISPTESGVIPMGCNVHDWMEGYLLVVDTPYFAKTNASGDAMIVLTQPGSYTVAIWHPELTDYPRQTLDLRPDENYRIVTPKVISNKDPQQPIDEFDFLEGY